jgi:transmembrane sensor
VSLYPKGIINNYQRYFNTREPIAKYLRNELTCAEKNELDEWLNSHPHNLELFNKLLDEALVNKKTEISSELEREKAWENIVKKTGLNKSADSFKWRRLLPYAAAIFLLFTAGIVVTNYLTKGETPKALAHHKQDLLPGSNKAILTLSNGSKIALNDAQQGKIANQRNVAIKIENGHVLYQIEGTDLKIEQPDFSKAVVMNTLTTPRGGQYEVVLPDGTRVWLNSATSLTYPVMFRGKERRVELTGEAYFEVAKDAASPFFVKTSNQTVEVLGTHFNINSYGDEKSVKTTLLEGSVKVTGNESRQVVKLSPPQQAVNISGDLKIVDNADIEEALAWKNGKFLFRNTDLQTVMRQLSRWYDVDIEYQGVIASKHYRGRISRNVPVSQVFEILKTSGVNFIINGRTIIVKS